MRLLSLLPALLILFTAVRLPAQVSFAPVVDEVQPQIVKIYGAGGLAGLEAYQSGFLISAEGHILTAWSHVLDATSATVHLHDGRRYEAELVGADPRVDVAVLKIDAENLPYFDLNVAPEATEGTRVLAFCNLFGIATGDEPASVLHGRIAITTPLAARSGAYPTLYRGPVYILDAMTNNPGAAGGALTDTSGRLLGMLGKEVQSTLTGTWLNYALPADRIRPAVHALLSGESADPLPEDRPRAEQAITLADLGLILVPDVLTRTPPFIDAVRPDSPAAVAGLAPDDLVVFLEERLVPSCQMLREELQFIAADQPVSLTVMRGDELVQVTLQVQQD
ncbi:MAG: S1C family serine protease [Pirellulales bacterium]